MQIWVSLSTSMPHILYFEVPSAIYVVKGLLEIVLYMILGLNISLT